MADLPVMLKISGKRCVVVGGGPVARRRVASLLRAGAVVSVIAPSLDRDEPFPKHPRLTIESRRYEDGDLGDAFLVVTATDDPKVNEAIADEAERVGALLNRADAPSRGHLTIPAHAQHGPITVAVHTGGVSPTAAATIRRTISAALDPDWPRLIELVAPYRRAIRARFDEADQRQKRLGELTAEAAMDALKKGGPDALHRYCRTLVEGAATDTSAATVG